MSSKTTDTTKLLGIKVGVIRYAAHNPREVDGRMRVMKNGRILKTWPVQLAEPGENERVDKLAGKVLGRYAADSKYAVAKGRYIHRTDGPTIVLTDERPTHVFFATNQGLRAYGGVNGYDVINVAEDCHIVAIPLNKAEMAIKNLVFA
jgi:hypothetical protein